MKSKKHDLAWLTGRISVDLQDATEKLIDIALNRLHDRDLAKEIAAVVDDLEGLKGIIYNAVAAPNFKAAKEESARLGNNRRGKVAKTVTLESLKDSLASARRYLAAKGQPTARGWIKHVEVDLGSSYRHVIKPRLAGWGISEADIRRFMETGDW